MTSEIGIVIAVISVAFILFWTEVLAVEVVGLLALLALVVSGVVDLEKAFTGFGNPALVMIASILVLSASLVRNGAGERIANRIERLAGGGTERMAVGLFGAVLFVSAFINNVAATAMFIPVAESLARTYRIRPSRLLMPVAYASLLGGVCTLTGSSTNVAVAGLLEKHGFRPIGIFEMTPVGLPLALVGMAYLLFFSRWLPGRAGLEEEVEDGNDHRLFATELVVDDGSPAIGRTLKELRLAERFRLSPVGLIRGAARLAEEVVDTPLKAGDVVVAEGDARAINRGARAAGLTRKQSSKTVETPAGAPALVEATVSYNSPLIGRTLAEVDLRGRYGLNVIAVWRRGGSIIEKIGHVRLRLGDDLLILGQLERIRQMAGEPLYLLLDDRVLPRYHSGREFLSLGVFGAAIVLGISGLVPIPLAFLAGALLAVITRCLTMEEAYRALNLKLILLIGSMIGVSVAMEQSGTAQWIAHGAIGLAGGADASPLLLLAGIYWLTVVLTQSMSNAAAAVLVVPVALSMATQLGVDPRPLAITVAVGASLAFMTPLEPACLLVMSTGRYRFRDFLVFGTPLTIICFALVMLLIPYWFPW